MGRPAKTPAPDYGRHLASLRKAAGLSQQELADMIGTRQSTIGSWERSPNPPRGETIPILANALGVSADELLQMKKVSKNRPGPASKIELLFEEVSNLPRRRQERIATVLKALLAEEAQAS